MRRLLAVALTALYVEVGRGSEAGCCVRYNVGWTTATAPRSSAGGSIPCETVNGVDETGNVVSYEFCCPAPGSKHLQDVGTGDCSCMNANPASGPGAAGVDQ